MERTGNRWRDQDKIRNPDGTLKPREEWENDPNTLANKANIKLNEYRGPDAQKLKYGPAVLGDSKPAEDPAPTPVAPIPSREERAQAAVAAAHAPPRSSEELAEVRPKLNPNFGQEMPTPPAVQASTPAAGPGIPV